jgi:mRNA interferase RelE/StbE
MMSKKRQGGPPRGPGRDRHEVTLTRAAERGLSRLPREILRRVDAKILALADEPHPPGSIKLQGANDVYRVRVGDYRILYQVEAARLVVVVVDVGHRREVYRPP